MKKTLITILAFLLISGMAQATLITTHQDAYVQYNAPDGNYGAATTLLLQDQVAANYRKAYIKFNVSTAPTPAAAGDVTLRLVVDSDNQSGTPITYANIGVYGINNSPDQDSWAEAAITKANAPENNQTDNGFGANATWLGDIAINNTDNGGTVLTLSNQALADFVAADTSGNVTIALNLTYLSGGANNYAVWLAAKENTTYDAPSLSVIPEPATIGLFASSAITIFLFRRRIEQL